MSIARDDDRAHARTERFELCGERWPPAIGYRDQYASTVDARLETTKAPGACSAQRAVDEKPVRTERSSRGLPDGDERRKLRRGSVRLDGPRDRDARLFARNNDGSVPPVPKLGAEILQVRSHVAIHPRRLDDMSSEVAKRCRQARCTASRASDEERLASEGKL